MNLLILLTYKQMNNPIRVFRECFEDIVTENYADALQHISYELLEDYKQTYNSKTDGKVGKNNISPLAILEDRNPLENLVNFVHYEIWKEGPFHLMRIQEISKVGEEGTRIVALVVEDNAYKIRYFDWEKERNAYKIKAIKKNNLIPIHPLKLLD